LRVLVVGRAVNAAVFPESDSRLEYPKEIAMKFHRALPRGQQGFSLLTAFILTIIMFGSLAYFLAGQGINAGFGATYSNTAKSSGLLASAGYVSTGFDAVILGGQSATAVTFDSTASTGIFNPTAGGAAPQPLDPSLFDPTLLALNTIHGYWAYRVITTTRAPAVALNNVGTVSAEYVIMASGLKQSVCEQINTALHGSATIPDSGVSNAILLGAATPPTATTPTGFTTGAAIDLSAILGTVGWLSGCYLAGTNYVYIHTLLAQ
jgi:hypothetical protein